MSYQPPPRPDPWADRLAGIAALRGMLGESTIKESAKIDTETRVVMPALQTLSVLVAWVVFLIGCWALIDGLVVAFQVNLNPGMYLLTFATIAAVVGGCGYGIYKAFSAAKPAVKWALALAGSLLVITAMMSAAMSLRAEFDFWRFVEIVVGSGAVLGSGLLIYHQLLNIVDPYWRTSPSERELLEMWRNQPPLAPPTVGSVRGQQRSITYRYKDEETEIPIATEILPPEEPVDIVEGPEDWEFEIINFLELAKDIGLGRKAWLEDADRFLTSTGTKVTKPKYNEMIDRLAEKGYVRKGGGPGEGTATDWVHPWTAKKALKSERWEFEDTWGNLL